MNEARSSAWALLPTACAIHCILTPLLVAVLPVMQFAHVAEPGLLAVSAVIAGVETRSGHRVHGVWVVTGLALVGAAIWALSIAEVFLAWAPEPLTSAAGGLTIAAALFWNGRLRHRKECATECSCPAPH